MLRPGLIGGVGWPSTLAYMRHINTGANRHFGDLTTPELLVCSLDFQPILELQRAGDWEGTATPLVAAARTLQRAGADFVLICSVTTNIASAAVAARIELPLLSSGLRF